jgi:hypothetical protein
LIVYSSDGLFGVEHSGKVERDSYVDVRGGGSVFANIFEK